MDGPLKRDFALEVHFSKWEFRARYHMTASVIESQTQAELLELAEPEDREAFESCWLGYSETWGDPELREAIAATYETAGPNDVLCFAGAEEGIYAAMRVLLGPEDHAIVVTPNNQAAETLPLSFAGASGVALDPDQDWSIDIAAVEAAITQRTRLLSINFPNNPTGKVLEREKLDALVALCRERGLYLFSDEVYRGVESDPDRRLPQVADLYEKGLSLNVMSKAYGLPGLRIGWIACRDRETLQRLERYKHYLSICNAVPAERLAVIALKARERILARNRALVAENLRELEVFFARHEALFDWRRPDGGCVAFPRYKGRDGVESFCARLVEEAGVLLLPASLYRSDLGPVPRDRFRIGFGRRGLNEGLRALENWLGRNRP
jgi:aspartate/methionine/tyrosine aminotransferase